MELIVMEQYFTSLFSTLASELLWSGPFCSLNSNIPVSVSIGTAGTAFSSYSSEFILAALCPNSIHGQEALCRPVILTLSAGSNCGHFLLTNTHSLARTHPHRHTREEEAWGELQLGHPPPRVTNGNGGRRACDCTLFFKTPTLNNFHHALIYTHHVVRLLVSRQG